MEVAMKNKNALTIDDVVKSGPIGRTSIYAAIKAGQLTARKFGKRTFVLTVDYDRFLRSLPVIVAPNAIGVENGETAKRPQQGNSHRF